MVNGSYTLGKSRNLSRMGLKLFKKEEVSFPNNLEIFILPTISESKNILLSSIPNPKQIKSTLFNMEDQKALGPNGFLAIFYKRYWDVVGKAITQAVTSFFVEGSMPKEINNSLIVLIPKS